MADAFETPWSGVGTGGNVALDFANTLDWRLRAEPVELLRSYPDLLRWAWTAGVLERREARALRAWGEAHLRPAAAALAEAIRVREAVAALCQARVYGKPLPAAALAGLEEACRSAWRSRALRPAASAAAWGWRDAEPGPERPAHAIALEAARLVTSADLERVRQCGDAECGWFFLDTSRNRTRRWCSMKTCGNRNKARRFYRRERRGRS